MNERITFYGTLESFEQISPEDYSLVIKEYESGKEWQIVATRWDVFEDLQLFHHYRCTGVKTLNGLTADEIDRWGRLLALIERKDPETGKYSYSVKFAEPKKNGQASGQTSGKADLTGFKR